MQGRNRGLDLAQAHHRHQRALQLADAHAPHHLGLAALAAIRVHQVLGTAALGNPPAFANGHQLSVVQRILGHQSADAQLLVGGRRQTRLTRQQGQRQAERARPHPRQPPRWPAQQFKQHDGSRQNKSSAVASSHWARSRMTSLGKSRCSALTRKAWRSSASKAGRSPALSAIDSALAT